MLGDLSSADFKMSFHFNTKLMSICHQSNSASLNLGLTDYKGERWCVKPITEGYVRSC